MIYIDEILKQIDTFLVPPYFLKLTKRKRKSKVKLKVGKSNIVQGYIKFYSFYKPISRCVF